MVVSPQFCIRPRSQVQPGSLIKAKDNYGITIKMPSGNLGMILLAHNAGRSSFHYHWDRTDSGIIDLGPDYILRADISKAVHKAYPDHAAGSKIFTNADGNFFAIALLDSTNFRLFDLKTGETSNNDDVMYAFPAWRIGVKNIDGTITWLIKENGS